MGKSKLYLSIAVLALSMGAYGCSYPYATRNGEYVNPGTGEIYNNTNSFSMYNDSNYYSNNSLNRTTSNRSLNRTTGITGNRSLNRTTGTTGNRSLNMTTGITGNRSLNMTTGTTGNRSMNMTTGNRSINTTTGNRSINMTTGNRSVPGGANAFTGDIVSRYSITTANVNNIRRGMTYDQVVAATGMAPYFTNAAEGSVVNNRKNGTAYYFVNGRTFKVSFINGKVDKASY